MTVPDVRRVIAVYRTHSHTHAARDGPRCGDMPGLVRTAPRTGVDWAPAPAVSGRDARRPVGGRWWSPRGRGWGVAGSGVLRGAVNTWLSVAHYYRKVAIVIWRPEHTQIDHRRDIIQLYRRNQTRYHDVRGCQKSSFNIS